MVQLFEAGAFMSEHGEHNIIKELAVISDSLEAIKQQVSAIRIKASEPVVGKPTALAHAKQHYQSRRDRDKLFGKSDLFGEPAWDMLIDLFIAEEEGRQVNVSRLCLATAVPATTALRWISMLESYGLIARAGDSIDPRRDTVSISSHAKDSIRSHFEQCGE
jgi:DNA-binding MarR family transcriptional regulator